MQEVKQLEMLSESVKHGIDELQSLLENSDDVLLKAKRSSFQKQLQTIINNLESTNDGIYSVFEDLNGYKGLEDDYNVLQDILQEKLSYEEKVDVRIKHGIDLY